jgi:hypothetical protein
MSWRRIFGPHAATSVLLRDEVYVQESVYGWGDELVDPELGEATLCHRFEFAVIYYVARTVYGYEVRQAWQSTIRDPATLEVVDDVVEHPVRAETHVEMAAAAAQWRCRRLAERDESHLIAWDPTVEDAP